jgi:uncharacterized protein (UPF0332 family)
MFMDWGKCKKDFIRETSIDTWRIASLLQTSAKRFEFISAIHATPDNVSFIIENYYEAAKELLTALIASRGMRSKNHQCLISFFYLHYPEHEAQAHFLLQLNHLRNRLDYYGELVEYFFYENNKERLSQLILMLAVLVKSPHSSQSA